MACHVGFIQFPMRKGWKRVHRLVVLPDYQGIGLGTRFQDFVVKHYNKNGWKVNCTTTTPALVGALKKSKKWNLARFGRVKNNHSKDVLHLRKSKSENRVTYSFNYKN